MNVSDDSKTKQIENAFERVTDDVRPIFMYSFDSK